MKKELSAKVIHHADDPAAWIVHVYEPGFLFRKKVASKLFISREDVEKYIESINVEGFNPQ